MWPSSNRFARQNTQQLTTLVQTRGNHYYMKRRVQSLILPFHQPGFLFETET